MPPKIRTDSITTINLLDVIREADEDVLNGGPIWTEVLHHNHGNQTFTNDSLFIYQLPSFNDEPLSPTQQRIADLCHEVIDDHTIVFEVCW
jgi:hypothetical protein